MLYIKINKLLLAGILLVLSLLGLVVYIGTLLGSSLVGHGLISNIAINCGSAGNSTAPDGRQWAGESRLGFTISGESRSSAFRVASAENPVPVPYKTSRISATEFRYTFPVNPGQKIIRLHFYPVDSYRGFSGKYWRDHFTVKAGIFTLLKDFSPSLAASAQTSGTKYVVREFCLNVEEESQELTLTFSPSLINGKSSNKKTTYAFVNGIEIITMPTGLYYTAENELGPRIVGLDSEFYIIDNSTALEVMHRLNIGGKSINSMEDVGLFRHWEDDTNYLEERPRAHHASHLTLKHKSPPAAYVAPAKMYRTSWKTDHQFTWKIPVDLGFRYLVRLHFGELNNYRMMGEREHPRRELTVVINNQIAETKADVNRWRGDVGIPVYKDYVVMMEGERQGTKFDISIGLHSLDELVFGLLNGLEIFKLSDLENNLAAPSPSLVFAEGFSTSSKPERDDLNASFGQTSNNITSSMTYLIILLSILTYMLRKICEEKVDGGGKSVKLASVKVPSCRCFSLAEIKLATEDFSEAFVVGRGGFGKVYRGLLPGFLNMVAIKRLNMSFSKQGATEFWAEIETLSKLRHIHLVSLIGYCDESPEMILVYEYIPGGTLADNLYKFARNGMDCHTLSWEQRLKICIGVARGLEYIHTSSQCGVIHRDIKDTNILLDENFVAKISDFGLSKFEQTTESKSFVDTRVKGTVGYLDPDYRTTNRLTRKTDVYSFGIVMLVVLTGKPAVDKGILGELEGKLLRSFEECMANGGDGSRIVDPRLQEEISSSSLKEFVRIVENCLHQLSKQRPTMAQVVSRLEHALELQQHHYMRSSILMDATVLGHVSEGENVHSLHWNHHGTKMLERSSVIPSPNEANTGKQTQKFASTVNLGGKTKDSVKLRKTLLGKPWKAIWNRGHVSEEENVHLLHSSLHETKMLERSSVISSPNEANTGKQTQKFASTVNLWEKTKDSVKLRKTLLGRPWKAIWNRGAEKRLRDEYTHQFTEDELNIFSLGSILVATNNFSGENKLGEGGFGPVYRGRLLDGREIAVKRLSRTSGQGSVEFKNELKLISKLQHTNLVEVVGCCIHKEEKILIYEYMPNKSLDFFLFAKDKKEHLDWKKRFDIIEGVAQGMLYLHEYSRVRVIHRDLKASNVLLDENMKPKISDFGMARILESNETEAITKIVAGTIGYMSPEYVMHGYFSIKSDVFSFGVLILEIVSGKRNSSFYDLEDQLGLMEYAWELWKEGKTIDLEDPALGDLSDDDTKQILRSIHVGLLCVQESATDRPIMSEVTSMLNNESMSLADPKHPPFYSGRRAFYNNNNDDDTNSSERENQGINLLVSVNDVSISVVDAK